MAPCTALLCRAQCSMPVRLLAPLTKPNLQHLQRMTGQWSDRSAISSCKILSPPHPMSYLGGLALRIWTSFGRREGSAGMYMWNAPMVLPRQPLTYRLMKRVGLGGPRWHGSSWQTGIAESWSSRLSTLMIDIPGDLVWDLPCVQQASYLEGGPLMWVLPLYLHVNKKSDDDDDDVPWSSRRCYQICVLLLYGSSTLLAMATNISHRLVIENWWNDTFIEMVLPVKEFESELAEMFLWCLIWCSFVKWDYNCTRHLTSLFITVICLPCSHTIWKPENM